MVLFLFDDRVFAIRKGSAAAAEARVAAENGGDEIAPGKILSAPFVATCDAGTPDFIASIMEAAQDPSHLQRVSDRTVTIDGDTAIVTGADQPSAVDVGKVFAMPMRFTATYLRRSGPWQALALRIVMVKPAPSPPDAGR